MESPVPDRRSHRLRGFDYAAPATYFVTLCTEERRCLFGRVEDAQVDHSAAGRMVLSWWHRIPASFPYVRLRAFVLMPNHLHGILRFLEPAVGGARVTERPGLGRVITWFKTRTTGAYTRGVRHEGWPRFNGRLWQRSFYEHIIRDEEELAHADGYILRNPRRWGEDPFHRP